MSILQLSPIKSGQVGVQPASYKMLSSDNLSTIMGAGYIKQGTGGQFFNKNDLIEVIYNFGTPTATNVELVVLIDVNGVITLNVDLPGGLGTAAFKSASNNLLPSLSSVNGATVLNHVAKFADTAGTITDGGILGTSASKNASDNASPTVASVSGSIIVGDVAIFSDTLGTIQDGGTLGTSAFKTASNNGSGTVASVDTPIVIGNALQAADVLGTIQDSGFALATACAKSASDNTRNVVSSVVNPTITGNVAKFNDNNGTLIDSGFDATDIQKESQIRSDVAISGIGGTGVGPYSVPVTGMTSAAIVSATLQSSSAPTAAVHECISTTGSFSVVFTVDPGAGSALNWIAILNPQ
ncbi:MAG: hypothetical protein EPO02_13675 [Nitrospirae bacterium]|nr:MAG: hypothetical protein EPO02_13675 [Nitrospirota bacterium]